MTVIYIDTLFLLNTLVDYLLLLASAKVAGEPLRRGRFALGAVLGGLYACAIFLPGMGFLSRPLCRVAAAVLMVLCAFWGTRRLLRQTLVFASLAFAFGGGVMAVSLLGHRGLSLEGGVVYSGLDLKIVLLSAAGCYAVLTLLFKKWARHTQAAGELLPVTLRLGARSVSFLALLDTGNTLSDPISGRPVLVAQRDCVAPLLPAGLLPEGLYDPAGFLAGLADESWRSRFRLLPYRAVGVAGGLLLALRVDEAQVGGRSRGASLVALSPSPVSDGGAYTALVGVE